MSTLYRYTTSSSRYVEKCSPVQSENEKNEKKICQSCSNERLDYNCISGPDSKITNHAKLTRNGKRLQWPKQ